MKISNEEWKARFIIRMIKHDPGSAKYAEDVVDDYLNMREDYDDPEDAAENDIEYWGL